MRRVALATMLLTGLAMSAEAAPITFSLTQANIAYPGPYADVTINLLNPTTAVVTFDGLSVAGNEYLFGGAGAVALNVDAASFTVSNFFGGNDGSGFLNQFGDLSQGAAGNEDGFGSFNLTVDSFDGYSHSWSEIGFTLTNTGGIWLTSNDVFTANGDGQFAAAHIFVCATLPTACTRSEGAIATGFASGFGSNPPPPPPPPPPPTVPEPSSLVLLGTGLIASAKALKKKLHGKGN